MSESDKNFAYCIIMQITMSIKSYRVSIALPVSLGGKNDTLKIKNDSAFEHGILSAVTASALHQM